MSKNGSADSKMVRHLIKQIEADLHRLDNDQALPTEQRYAEQLGVSNNTLRQALKVLEGKGLISRANANGTYSKKQRQHSRKRTRLGLLLTQHTVKHETGYTRLVYQGVANMALQQNCELVIASPTVRDDTAHREILYQLLDDSSIDGVIINCVSSRTLPKDLQKWDKPVCFIDHDGSVSSMDYIRADSYAGSQLAVTYLVKRGHQKIAYANYSKYLLNQSRLKGFQDALTEHDLPFHTSWHFQSPNVDHSSVIAQQYLNIEAQQRPTAIVAFSDHMAELIIRALQHHGISIPDDLEIVGFKGSYEDLPNNDINIPNIVFDWHKAGQLAVETMIERIQNPRNEGKQIFIKPRIVEPNNQFESN